MSWPETRHDKTNTKQFKRFWLGRETEFRPKRDTHETDMSSLARDSEERHERDEQAEDKCVRQRDVDGGRQQNPG